MPPPQQLTQLSADGHNPLPPQTPTTKPDGTTGNERSRLCLQPARSRANAIATTADSLLISNATNHLVGIVSSVSDRK